MSVRQWIENVEGWLTVREATLLYSLAKSNLFDGVIVEIGSWKGKSTICLAKGSLEGKQNIIYAIDPHSAPATKLKRYLREDESNTFSKFRENIQRAM